MSNRKQPPSRPPARGNSARPNATRVVPTRPQKGAPPPSGFNPLYLVGGLLVVGVLLIGFLVLSTNNGGTGGTGGTGGAGCTTCRHALVETPKGNFTIELFDDPAAAGTVKNFRDKVNSGYFNAKIFHRVEDWVIQGGDPLGTGTGGGNIPGEYAPGHSFVTGAVGMASTASHAAQVNDSQWFVVKKDSTFLDGNYDIFGQVTQGMDVVNKIAIGDAMTKITMQP